MTFSSNRYETHIHIAERSVYTRPCTTENIQQEICEKQKKERERKRATTKPATYVHTSI